MTLARKPSGSKVETKATTLKFHLKSGEFMRAARHRLRYLPLAVLALAVPSVIAEQWIAVAAELAIAITLLLMPLLLWGGADRVLKEKSDHSFDNEGHTVQSPTEKVHRSWSAFDNYTETKKLFILYSRGSVAVVVPKRVLATAADERKLRILLASNLSTIPQKPGEKEEDDVPAHSRRKAAKADKRELTAVVRKPVPASQTIAGPQVDVDSAS